MTRHHHGHRHHHHHHVRHHHAHHRGGGGALLMMGPNGISLISGQAVTLTDGSTQVLLQGTVVPQQCCTPTAFHRFDENGMTNGCRAIMTPEEYIHICQTLNAVEERHRKPCIGWVGLLWIGVCILVCGSLCVQSALNNDMIETCKELEEDFKKKGRTLRFQFAQDGLSGVLVTVPPVEGATPGVVAMQQAPPPPGYAPPAFGAPMLYQAPAVYQPGPPAYQNAPPPPPYAQNPYVQYQPQQQFAPQPAAAPYDPNQKY